VSGLFGDKHDMPPWPWFCLLIRYVYLSPQWIPRLSGLPARYSAILLFLRQPPQAMHRPCGVVSWKDRILLFCVPSGARANGPTWASAFSPTVAPQSLGFEGKLVTLLQVKRGVTTPHTSLNLCNREAGRSSLNGRATEQVRSKGTVNRLGRGFQCDSLLSLPIQA